MQGRGFPDVGTRRLVFEANHQLGLPVYVVCDADPSGLNIMLVYRHGTSAHAEDNHVLCVPAARWLGVHPGDVRR